MEGKRVLVAMSGGVDSSVAAALLDRAVGDKLTCIFVDHGLMRGCITAKRRGPAAPPTTLTTPGLWPIAWA